MNKNIIDPYKILIGNQGYMKINGIEIAELKDLEVKITPEMREIGLLNSATKGKYITAVNGTITFELNKIYSRFKPAILACAKYLQPFTFSLEATVYAPKDKNKKHREEESIHIEVCWLEGDISLFALKSEADFLTEKFQAGFQIESAKFTDVIDDGNEWGC
ncbi:phage tail tube protein [Clostridium chromiireducens]|uniref:phage tail tube protein n=1 Tax=Clostridium chromiireducens TaxID=225345 RepID=UPI003AF41214